MRTSLRQYSLDNEKFNRIFDDHLSLVISREGTKDSQVAALELIGYTYTALELCRSSNDMMLEAQISSKFERTKAAIANAIQGLTRETIEEHRRINDSALQEIGKRRDRQQQTRVLYPTARESYDHGNLSATRLLNEAHTRSNLNKIKSWK